MPNEEARTAATAIFVSVREEHVDQIARTVANAFADSTASLPQAVKKK